jgi:hypothetical protein
MPTLGIGPERVCFVVLKERERDVKVAPEWMDDGSNPGDDRMAQILEGYDTIRSSRGYPRALNDDAPEHLQALT